MCYFSKISNLSIKHYRWFSTTVSLLILLSSFSITESIAQDNNFDSLFTRARTMLERSKPDKAVPVLLYIAENVPRNSQTYEYAHINLAEAYRMRAEYKKGTDLLYGIISSETLTPRNRAYAYNRMAALYGEWRKIENWRDSTIKYSQLCVEISQKHNFRQLLAASQNELGYVARLQHRTKDAVELCLSAYTIFYEEGQYANALNAAINLGGAYLVKGDYHKGIQLLDTADRHLNTKEYDNLQARAYMRKSDFYLALEDYENGFWALDKARKLQEKAFKGKLNMQISEMTAKYDLQQKEIRIKEAKHQSEVRRQRLMLFLVLSILLATVLTATLINFRLKRTVREREKKLIRQENSELKAKLGFKQKELEYKSKELGKAITEAIAFNDVLKDIKSAVAEDDKKTAVRIINQNRNLEQNWNKFRLNFEDVYPSFLNKLAEKFPRLTDNDQRICAFILMELKTSDIAKLSGISEASVSKSRNRLRKKLGLESGADIRAFLKSIY